MQFACVSRKRREGFRPLRRPAVQAQLDRLAALSVPEGGSAWRRSAPCWSGSAIRIALAAGVPCRRDQRQGIDLRLPARDAGGRGPARPCHHQPASGALQRAHPDCGRTDFRCAAGAICWPKCSMPARTSAPSFFEVTIAAAFTEFARVPADACVVEVGLGGRFDATNVLIERPGRMRDRRARHRSRAVPAGPRRRARRPSRSRGSLSKRPASPKAGVPFATARPDDARRQRRSTPRHSRSAHRCSVAWHCEPTPRASNTSAISENYRSAAPSLAGATSRECRPRHRHAAGQRHSPGFEEAIREGLTSARWPARLQRLSPGPLSQNANCGSTAGIIPAPPSGCSVISPGACNEGVRLHLIIGMLAGKDPSGFMAVLRRALPRASPSSPSGPRMGRSSSASARVAPLQQTFRRRLRRFPDDGLPVLIAGSLYLAGEVLRLNGEVPT